MTRRIRIFCAATLALGVATSLGCKPSASPEQCEQFADHFLELMAKSEDKNGGLAKDADLIATELRPRLVDSCTQDASAKEVECVIASSSMEQVEQNCR